MSSVASDACSSTRASGAPRQKWMPAPKPRCGLGERARSSRSGSANTAGSRLAAPSSAAIFWPGSTVTAPIRTGTVAVRSNSCSGESYRISSSTAPGTSSGVSLARSAGMGEQRVRAVADDVDARLVPGHLQQHRGRHQLVLGQPAAVGVPGRDEVGEQVVARAPAPVARSAPGRTPTYSAAAALGGPPASPPTAPARTASRSRSTTAGAGRGRSPARRAASRSPRPAAARRRAGAGRRWRRPRRRPGRPGPARGRSR